MIDTELLKSMLKGVPEGELKHWSKINGYDEPWFDTIYAQWLEANPEGVLEAMPESTEPNIE